MSSFSIKSANDDIRNLIEIYHTLDIQSENLKIYTQRSRAILYASIILLIYNFIEWSVKDCLNRIFNAFNEDNVQFWDLTDEWKLYLIKEERIKLNYFDGKAEKNAIVKDLYPELDFKFNNKEKNKLLKTKYKIKDRWKNDKNVILWINGNINEQKILEISSTLWIDFNLSVKDLTEKYREKFFDNYLEAQSFNLKKTNPLNFIKTERNKLAHWQTLFSEEEYSNYTTNDIEELANSVIIYIDLFNNSVKKFIKHKKWRRNNIRNLLWKILWYMDFF